MKKIVLLSVMLLLSTSCKGGRPTVGPPWMQDLLTQGPEGPTNFREGWRDGCESGIAATSNRLQRGFYNFKQNYELSQDPVYYTGWKTAWNYCQRYVFQYLRRNII